MGLPAGFGGFSTRPVGGWLLCALLVQTGHNTGVLCLVGCFAAGVIGGGERSGAQCDMEREPVRSWKFVLETHS